MKARRRESDVSGFLVVDKPAGWTSHDVVDAARQLDPDMAISTEIACAGEHEIAETAQSCGGFLLSPRRVGETGDFGQTASDERGERILTEAQPLHHAGGSDRADGDLRGGRGGPVLG